VALLILEEARSWARAGFSLALPLLVALGLGCNLLFMLRPCCCCCFVILYVLELSFLLNEKRAMHVFKKTLLEPAVMFF
jgi:hypothetical protein